MVLFPLKVSKEAAEGLLSSTIVSLFAPPSTNPHSPSLSPLPISMRDRKVGAE